MSRYQYGYYDPVGSSQPQPTGYTYQSSSNAPPYPSAAASSGYGSNNQQNYGATAYGAQTYGNSAQNNSSTSHAAAALSSLGNQDYTQTSNRSSAGQYDGSQWYGSNNATAYGSGNLQPPNRSQVNNSPSHASAPSSTFGRLSVPDQSQSSSATYASSATYQNAPSNAGANYRYPSNTTQAAQNPPQRYNSPLHAVQAQQQGHQKQSSRGSTHQDSPQMSAARYAQQNRQASASVEPSPTTVDPSQVYDNRAELERKARIEAERRKKIEAEQAARKAEDERLDAERRKAEEAKQQAAEEAEAAKKKEQQDRKNEARRKAREEKRQSKSAATTLQQMASMGVESTAPPADEEEAEMRAMFKKMREFNSKNPAMLAKLWEEERKQHAESQSPQPQSSSPAVPAASDRTTHSRQSAAQSQPKSVAPPTRVPPPQQQPPMLQTKNVATNQASPQANAARPGAPSSNTSLWPPHKKGALADATAKWLMGLPGNAGKNIGQQAVLNILNTNPSYVQLCESLEALDMKFERSALARELLKAVPDGLRTQQKPPTPVPTTNGSTISSGAHRDSLQASRPTSAAEPKSKGVPGPTTVSYSTPPSLSDAAREINQMHKSAPPSYGDAEQTQQFTPHPVQLQAMSERRPSSQARASSQSQPPEVKPETLPKEPPRAPANKEEAARKRTFGDLVDLTVDEESDDDAPAAKKQFVLPSASAVPSNGPNVHHRDPLAYLQQQPQPSMQQQQQQQQYKPFNYQSKDQVPQAGIMNPPQHANRQQPVVQTKPKGPSAETLQQSRMRGRMLVEPIMRDRVARKSRYDPSTIARDVLLATGRHPDMRGLNHHLNAMQRLLGAHGGETDSMGTRCDLSTVRWDIIDPDPPKEDEKKGAEAANRASVESSPDPIAAADGPSVSATVEYEAPFQHSPSTATVPRTIQPKRGRPRISDSAAMLGERASSANANTPKRASSTANKPDTTFYGTSDAEILEHANSMAATGTPVGYSAFRQIGPDGQVIKKKGRPVGWRKNVHSREAQGLPPHYPHKKVGTGASKEAGTGKSKGLVEPEWESFLCEWKGCKADLQNLDTLKKHLIKVHGREMEGGRGFECVWKSCDRQPGEGGGFDELEQWISHVDKAHLQPIAWKQGDGPRGGSLGDSPFYRQRDGSSPAYLNDAYGRSVTPVIEPTPPPSQSSTTNQTQQLPIHTSTIPKLERDANAELEKLAEHKMIVGPLMDRQGCVVASKERRVTFLGDEDFEHVVYADEADESLGAWG